LQRRGDANEVKIILTGRGNAQRRTAKDWGGRRREIVSERGGKSTAKGILGHSGIDGYSGYCLGVSKSGKWLRSEKKMKTKW